MLAGLLLLTLLPARLLSAADDSPSLRLQLKWYHQFQFAGYYAAQEKGFYRQAGLHVSILEGDADHPPIQEVVDGRADYGVSDADVLIAYLKGKPLVVLAAIFQHSPYILLTRADSGIRTPSALRGRTIMLSDEQGIAQIKAMFRREGMSLDAVTVLAHQWNNDLLIEGQVDAISAYSTVEPYQLRLKGVEPGIIRAVDYGVDFYGDTLFTTRAEVDNHPDRVAAFHKASLQGWEYAMEHPDEVIELILNMPGVRLRGVTREMLQYEAQAMRELILPGLVDIGHMNPGRWETIARIYAEVGVLNQRPSEKDLRAFIHDPTHQPNGHWVKPLAFSLAALALLSIAILVWNLQLRKAVVRRTEALRESENRLRGTFENAAVGIGNISPSGQWLSVNRKLCSILGYEREELLQETFYSMIHPEDLEATRALLAEVCRGDSDRYATDIRCLRKGGETVWVHLTLGARRAGDDQLPYCVGVVQDITARKQAELELQKARDELMGINSDLERRVDERTAELREAVAELEQMSYSMIHDLRAPLRAIQGFSTMLKDQISQEQHRGLLERIMAATARMDNLICDVLNYSKVVRTVLPLQPVDVVDLVKGIVQTSPDLQPPQAELSVAEDIPRVIGNPAALIQCLSNLLRNAVKYTKPGETPRIQVRAAPAENGDVRIVVQDFGIGIPAQYKHKLFGLFQRLHGGEHGTGMGLAIVRKAAERMGGRVGVDSELGVGSSFWIELRKADAPHNSDDP